MEVQLLRSTLNINEKNLSNISKYQDQEQKEKDKSDSEMFFSGRPIRKHTVM